MCYEKKSMCMCAHLCTVSAEMARGGVAQGCSFQRLKWKASVYCNIAGREREEYITADKSLSPKSIDARCCGGKGGEGRCNLSIVLPSVYTLTLFLSRCVLV